MSSLINVSINLQDLPKEKFVQGKKGVYYNFTLSVNDETNQFGQNVSVYDNQTKEERDAKKDKFYIGNGKVVWTNGSCVAAEKDGAKKETVASTSNDLPF
jgi:hypothetical protein|tara:strand:+ start:1124 stop:1423 length:300 start_codon:yes stop_codon:yes gene_type:complete